MRSRLYDRSHSQYPRITIIGILDEVGRMGGEQSSVIHIMLKPGQIRVTLNEKPCLA